MRVQEFAGRQRIFVVGAVLATGLAVFLAVWFEPQKLFINTTVKEAAPVVKPRPTSHRSGASSSGAAGSRSGSAWLLSSALR